MERNYVTVTVCIVMTVSVCLSVRDHMYGKYTSDLHQFYPAPNRGAEYCDERVCLSVSVCLFVCPRSYLRNYTSDLRQFLCMLLTAVARSSSGGVAIRIRYVLPVLSMTSCLHMTTVVYSDTKTTCAQSSSPGGSTGGGVCCPRLTWQYRLA